MGLLGEKVTVTPAFLAWQGGTGWVETEGKKGHCVSRGGNLVGFGPSAFVDVFVVIVEQT